MILLPASIMSSSQMTMEQMSLYCTVRAAPANNRATTGKHLAQGETANDEIMTYKPLNNRKWHENENGQSHDIFSSCATHKAQSTIFKNSLFYLWALHGFATTLNRSLEWSSYQNTGGKHFVPIQSVTTS
jgi:hypothetical protein